MSRARALATLVATALIASLMLLPSSSAEKAHVAAEPRTRARNTTVLPVKAFYRNGQTRNSTAISPSGASLGATAT
jgi:hypothetical protein